MKNPMGVVTRKGIYARFLDKVRGGKPQFDALSDALHEAFLAGCIKTLTDGRKEMRRGK